MVAIILGRLMVSARGLTSCIVHGRKIFSNDGLTSRQEKIWSCIARPGHIPRMRERKFASDAVISEQWIWIGNRPAMFA